MKTVPAYAHKQDGAVLVVGLIMLVLITILITTAFNMSSTNIRAVGNMQFRNEAVAAANKAIEQVLSSPFTVAPTAEEITVDIDNDGTTDYNVAFAIPVCVSASEIASTAIPPSSTSLGSAFPATASSHYETVWDLNASVTDVNNSGAAVQVHQGVRVLLDQAQYDAVCS